MYILFIALVIEVQLRAQDPAQLAPLAGTGAPVIRSISEMSSRFFGPRPWHIEIRHRVKKTSTINLFGFETLKLRIRRLKLWKPTVIIVVLIPKVMIITISLK